MGKIILAQSEQSELQQPGLHGESNTQSHGQTATDSPRTRDQTSGSDQSGDSQQTCLTNDRPVRGVNHGDVSWCTLYSTVLYSTPTHPHQSHSINWKALTNKIPPSLPWVVINPASILILNKYNSVLPNLISLHYNQHSILSTRHMTGWSDR